MYSWCFLGVLLQNVLHNKLTLSDHLRPTHPGPIINSNRTSFPPHTTLQTNTNMHAYKHTRIHTRRQTDAHIRTHANKHTRTRHTVSEHKFQRAVLLRHPHVRAHKTTISLLRPAPSRSITVVAVAAGDALFLGSELKPRQVCCMVETVIESCTSV